MTIDPQPTANASDDSGQLQPFSAPTDKTDPLRSFLSPIDVATLLRANQARFRHVQP